MKKQILWALAFAFAMPSAAFAREITSFAEPYRDIDIASPELGTLSLVKVKEGDQVAEGQVLAVLNEEVLQAALVVAQKSMEASGKLKSAMAQLRLHEDQLSKLRSLRERGHSTDGEIAQAEAQRAIVEAQVLAVRDELAVKKADYKRIKMQLEQKRIKSPINGIVTHVYRDPGEFVSASEPVIVKVVQLNPLLVVFSVPKSEAQKLTLAQEVPVEVGAGRTKTQGVIEFVSPTADAQSGTVRVKVRISNGNGEFQSGDGCWLKIAEMKNKTTKYTGLKSEKK